MTSDITIPLLRPCYDTCVNVDELDVVYDVTDGLDVVYDVIDWLDVIYDELVSLSVMYVYIFTCNFKLLLCLVYIYYLLI